MPEEARLARIDSDDFVVLVRRRGESLAALRELAERLRAILEGRFEAPLMSAGEPLDVTIATGASVFARSTRFGDALATADRCLRASRDDLRRAAEVVRLF
jgi:GGDEF domain-containing protein